MGLLDEVLQHKTYKPPCTMSLIIEALDPDDRADLKAALDNPAVVAAAIVNALERRGQKVGAETVRRHRRGVCSCG